jgi:4-hydroxybenzoate polyprenyltransferase
VIATDSGANLKGAAKAARLAERFGERGFAYAGNDGADLAVWSRAGAAVLVNADPQTTRRARDLVPLEREFPRSGGRLLVLARAMRLYQWVKNLLVFVAPMAAHTLFQPGPFAAALVMFIAFGLTASGIYLLNDVADLPSDRRHPRKRERPFASGALPIVIGLALGPLLIVAGVGLAIALGWKSVVVLTAYAATSIAYSLGMKKLPLVDVFMLAGLYTIRVVAGGVAADVPVSNWLLSASGFFFLGLAFLKRYVELTRVAASEAPGSLRRGYYAGDAAVLQMMGVCSGFVACLVLALYISSEPALKHYAQPDMLWGAVPLLAFWICRLWLSGMRGYVHDDPIVYAAKDWVSWSVVVAMGIVGLGATMGLGG